MVTVTLLVPSNSIMTCKRKTVTLSQASLAVLLLQCLRSRCCFQVSRTCFAGCFYISLGGDPMPHCEAFQFGPFGSCKYSLRKAPGSHHCALCSVSSHTCDRGVRHSRAMVLQQVISTENLLAEAFTLIVLTSQAQSRVLQPPGRAWARAHWLFLSDTRSGPFGQGQGLHQVFPSTQYRQHLHHTSLRS